TSTTRAACSSATSCPPASRRTRSAWTWAPTARSTTGAEPRPGDTRYPLRQHGAGPLRVGDAAAARDPRGAPALSRRRDGAPVGRHRGQVAGAAGVARHPGLEVRRRVSRSRTAVSLVVAVLAAASVAQAGALLSPGDAFPPWTLADQTGAKVSS